ncbi:uncharacterized protein LOC133037136 isoform X1 [Cannabis sativa]|uniref:uncharacterized protein LOC133037136 isoform X1 n=1 Tax=Cannabis sativa TaxID=3483 RepID=UPI0029C9B51A|nr:uncharacterized protein LOC133037136 isoform X1 [Cannabis sativa]
MDANGRDDDDRETLSNSSIPTRTRDLSFIVEDLFKRSIAQEKQPNMESSSTAQDQLDMEELTALRLSSSSFPSNPAMKLRAQEQPNNMELAAMDQSKMEESVILQLSSFSFSSEPSRKLTQIEAPVSRKRARTGFPKVCANASKQKSEYDEIMCGVTGVDQEGPSYGVINVGKGEDIIGKVKSFASQIRVETSSVVIVSAVGDVLNPTLTKYYRGKNIRNDYEGQFKIARFYGTIDRGVVIRVLRRRFEDHIDEYNGEVIGTLIAAATTYVHVKW